MLRLCVSSTYSAPYGCTARRTRRTASPSSSISPRPRADRLRPDGWRQAHPSPSAVRSTDGPVLSGLHLRRKLSSRSPPCNVTEPPETLCSDPARPHSLCHVSPTSAFAGAWDPVMRRSCPICPPLCPALLQLGLRSCRPRAGLTGPLVRRSTAAHRPGQQDGRSGLPREPSPTRTNILFPL